MNLWRILSFASLAWGVLFYLLSYGIMNTGANIGGTISPTLTPWLAERFGWNLSLGFAALVAVLGGVLWLLVKPGDGLRQG